MSIDALATWKSEFANLPKVSDTSWKQNLADYIAARVDGKLKLSTYTPDSGITFAFNKAAFLSALSSVSAGTGDGVNAIAAGVKAAVVVPGSLVVVAPISVGSPSPTNTFSVVLTSIISPASAALAETKIQELSGAAPVSDVNNSLFPVKLRDAFLLLTADITGLDSTPPTPIAKADLGRAVI